MIIIRAAFLQTSASLDAPQGPASIRVAERVALRGQAEAPAGLEAPDVSHAAALDESRAEVQVVLHWVASDAFRAEEQDALPVLDASRSSAERDGNLSATRGAAAVWIPDAFRWGAALAGIHFSVSRSGQAAFLAARSVSAHRVRFAPAVLVRSQEEPLFFPDALQGLSILVAELARFANREQLAIRRSDVPHYRDLAFPAVALPACEGVHHSPWHTTIDLSARTECVGFAPVLEERDARSWPPVLSA